MQSSPPKCFGRAENKVRNKMKFLREYWRVGILLAWFVIGIVLLTSCAPKVAKPPGNAAESAYTGYDSVVMATLETTSGEETVLIRTKTYSTCKWLRDYLKKYGKYAHIVAIEECRELK